MQVELLVGRLLRRGVGLGQPVVQQDRVRPPDVLLSDLLTRLLQTPRYPEVIPCNLSGAGVVVPDFVGVLGLAVADVDAALEELRRREDVLPDQLPGAPEPSEHVEDLLAVCQSHGLINGNGFSVCFHKKGPPRTPEPQTRHVHQKPGICSHQK